MKKIRWIILGVIVCLLIFCTIIGYFSMSNEHKRDLKRWTNPRHQLYRLGTDFLLILSKEEKVEDVLQTFKDYPKQWYISNDLVLDKYGSPYYFDNQKLNFKLIKSWPTYKKDQIKLFSLGADKKRNTPDDIVYIIDTVKETVKPEKE